MKLVTALLCSLFILSCTDHNVSVNKEKSDTISVNAISAISSNPSNKQYPSLQNPVKAYICKDNKVIAVVEMSLDKSGSA